ncbi:MAG TPA: phosphoglucosamine mutase [Pirellulaceae bacterium]|nr:phosphoglucosamine mutase [Pirellulaceae bacterium]
MRNEPIISVSGLRGIVGESLTPEVAIRYVAAFAATLPDGPVVVSRDGRTTGLMLAAAVHSALLASGRPVLDAGICATPTVGVLVKAKGAAGGVQISASHNPLPYNGLKLFNGDGRVIPAGPGREVLAAYRSGKTAWAPYYRVGNVEPIINTTTDHLSLLLKTIDAETIRRVQFRVLLDSNAGAGSILGRRLLETLGCQVTLLGGEPSGRFEHPPEPTADNLQSVGKKVVAARCQVGFCQDPDADRLAIIDENGRYIGEEYTLAICLDHVLRQSPGPLVTNCATSRMSQDLAKKYHVPFFRSAVGEANVVDEMLARSAAFGGEGNGGPIDPRVVLVRDSFVGMAQVLSAMASRKEPVSKLADELPRYEIRKTTVQFAPEKLPAALNALEKHFGDANADRLDGLRLDWPDRWLIVRGSNTEPIVRVIAEAPTAADADTLCQQVSAVLAE